MPSPRSVSYETQTAGLYSCLVALNGDPRQVIARDQFNPCTLPEIYLLQETHGQTSVTEIVLEREVEMSPGEVQSQLEQRYPQAAPKFLAQFSLDSIGLMDGSFPSREALEAGEKAKAEAMAQVKKKPAKKAAKEAPVTEPKLPDITV
jgi:hypothetical protein